MDYLKQKLRMMEKQNTDPAARKGARRASIKEELQERESTERRHSNDQAVCDTIGGKRWSSNMELSKSKEA